MGVLAHQLDDKRAKSGSLAPIRFSYYFLFFLKKMTKDEIMAISSAVAEHIANTSKEVLTTKEAANYLGISLSYLYKLTSRGEIPHSKPMGKVCFFSRPELEEWAKNTNRVASAEEIASRASNYLTKKGGVL